MDGGGSDNRLGEFLRARRELARPEDFGLPDPARRRVPGLRREEVALLAGVSADYYVRLEQGRDKRPSEQVIEALARVFDLADDALAHLHELARPVRRRRRPAGRVERVGPGVLRLLESWSATPAMVVGRYLDILATNALAAAVNACSTAGANQVRLMFLDPAMRDIFPDWEVVARETVASLRATAGLDQDDPRLTELVGELSVKSEDFRRLWARHDVLVKAAGRKRFRHPMVGDLDLGYETFAVNGVPGQMLVVYHADPGSPAEGALALLSSMVAGPTDTADPTTRADAPRA